MQRGDLVTVDLGRGVGSEAHGLRPAVIVSNDGANRTARRLGRGVLTVVPITSNTKSVYPFQVFLPSNRCQLGRDSKAQAEQVRPIATERIRSFIGRLPADLVDELDAALRLHLAL